jgi:hypothetical protein
MAARRAPRRPAFTVGPDRGTKRGHASFLARRPPRPRAPSLEPPCPDATAGDRCRPGGDAVDRVPRRGPGRWSGRVRRGSTRRVRRDRADGPERRADAGTPGTRAGRARLLCAAGARRTARRDGAAAAEVAAPQGGGARRRPRDGPHEGRARPAIRHGDAAHARTGVGRGRSGGGPADRPGVPSGRVDAGRDGVRSPGRAAGRRLAPARRRAAAAALSALDGGRCRAGAERPPP